MEAVGVLVGNSNMVVFFLSDFTVKKSYNFGFPT